MAINRYDTPAQADFINTYVPIPFDQMMKVGMMKQALVEDNDKLTDETLGALNAIKVAPADEPAYLEKAEGIKKEINNIINTAQPGSYEAKRKLMALRNQLSTDSDLREWSQNYSVYTGNEKLLQDANKDKVTDPNKRELLELRRNLSAGGKGTRGLREETGSGLYNTGTYFGNVDTREGIEAMVNNVDTSSFESETPGGPYNVTTKTGGITMDALGAPLGLSFEQGKDKDGNTFFKTNIKDFDTFESNLRNKEWGQQYIRDAQHELGKSSGTIDAEVMDLATNKAVNEMKSAIAERVKLDSSTTITADPYYEYEWKKKVDDQKDILSWPVATTMKGTGIKDLYSLKAGVQAADEIVESATASLKDLQSKTSSIPIKDTDGKIIGYEYVNAKGEDVSDEMRKRIAVNDDAVQKQDDMKNLLQQTKEEAASNLKVSVNQEPSMDIKRKAMRKGIEDAIGTSGLPAILSAFEISKGNLSSLSTLPEDTRQRVLKAYNKHLDELDPYTKEVNRLLAEKAKDRSITIGLSDFPTKSDNEQMTEGFMRYATTDELGTFGGNKIGLKDAVTDRPLTDKEYANINNKEKALYLGWNQNVNTGEIEVWYRPYAKDGVSFAPDVKMPAPGGFINKLVKNNMTNQAELYVGNELSNASTGVDRQKKIVFVDGNGKEFTVEFRALTGTEKKQYTPGAEYQLKYNELSAATGLPGPTVVNTYTREEAIAKMLDYAQKMNDLNKVTK